MDKLLKKMDSLDPEERKRLRTLLEEKTDKKTEVQWMYKCDKPGSEEYLLGRRIDKHIEEPKETEETDKDNPGALFEEVIARRTDLDMHTKMREDPLYAIRRKEEEARKKLLQNPIKMKHLQKLIEEKEQNKARKKRKEKKHKKHKKHKHRSSSSSSDSDDSLVRQYLEVVKKKQQMCAGVREASRSEDEHEEVMTRQYGLIVPGSQEAVPKKSHRRETESESTREERHIRPGRETSGSRETERESTREERRKRHGREANGCRENESESTHDERHKRHRRETSGSREIKSESTRDERHKRHRRETSVSRETKSESTRDERHKRHGREDSGGRTSSPHSKSRSHRRSSSQESQSSRHRPSEPKREDRKRKLDSDAMAKKRQAMLENAKWRDEQRRDNVKKYKEEAAKEKTVTTEHKHGADFLNPLLREHAAQSSLADRIKRNIYSIQRTTADLDKNFTKQ